MRSRSKAATVRQSSPSRRPPSKRQPRGHIGARASPLDPQPSNITHLSPPGSLTCQLAVDHGGAAKRQM